MSKQRNFNQNLMLTKFSWFQTQTYRVMTKARQENLVK